MEPDGGVGSARNTYLRYFFLRSYYHGYLTLNDADVLRSSSIDRVSMGRQQH